MINQQDTFLNLVRKEAVPVTVYLVNGFQLRGIVRGFDQFTVVLENEGRQMLVYKHALSTIAPSRPINLHAAQQQYLQQLQQAQQAGHTQQGAQGPHPASPPAPRREA